MTRASSHPKLVIMALVPRERHQCHDHAAGAVAREARVLKQLMGKEWRHELDRAAPGAV
jgi:hypothetical protein